MIRFANQSDVDKIAKIHIDNVKRTYKDIYPNSYFSELSFQSYVDDWISYLKRLDCRTIVYCRDEEILGFASICLYYSKERMPLLDRLHVKHSFESRGIGKELMLAVYSILQLERIDEMVVYCVEGNNRAMQFYRNLGARSVGALFMNNRNSFSNLLKIDCIKNYIGEYRKTIALDLCDEYELLLEYVQSDYILWGLGDYYNRFVDCIGYKYKPVAIYDNKKSLQGLSVNGVSIRKPEKTDLPIIIAVSKYTDVEKQIIELGCEKSVRFYPWHKYMEVAE